RVCLLRRCPSESAPVLPAAVGSARSPLPPVALPASAPLRRPQCRQPFARPPLPRRYSHGSARRHGRGYPPATPCRTENASESWVPVWSCGRVPLGGSGACLGCVGSCPSPLVSRVATHTEPEPLCSTGITQFPRSYGLLRLLPQPPPVVELQRIPLHCDRSPALRWVACVRAAPNTPAGLPVRFGSLKRAPLVFAVIRAARPPPHSFRGLLRLHSRCGPYTCLPDKHGDLCPSGFGALVTRCVAQVATKANRQFLGLDLHPLHTQHLCAALPIRPSYVYFVQRFY